ncbi:T9SS type A sorting domain-containing protein [Flavobacterium gelidilacus]|uniref:T9SS type A sorting domain-containing protein n=1 Tax=Flavobacterium gelidilacus TaxID=206041 RepID=UPI001FE01FBA|nr:T9SS type A sorting domain-containing protein [Flavobacterium gelidilacus]
MVLTVPAASNTTYTWQVSANGGTTFTTIPGNTTMTYNPPTTGNYIFSVVANSGGCSSALTTHSVMVYQTPNFPLLAITNVLCNPYQVTVSVTNPQTDVVYIWSNGTIGTTAISYHDGPLQVRAELLGCSRTNQIDLPVDLNSHKWLFPNGCYDFCNRDNFNGYIIGPNEDLNEWIWTTPNGEESGSGFMSDVNVGNGEYLQFLDSGYCHETFGTAQIKVDRCDKCDINITDVMELYCDQISNKQVYYVSFAIDNAIGNTLYTTLTAPNGEGYFSPSTITLNGGTTVYTGYFIPNNGFNGGNIVVNLNSTDGKELNCLDTSSLDFMSCNVPRMAPPKNKIALAPNPASYTTTVYYELVAKGTIQLILTDAMGRELYTTMRVENKGSIELDISQWSKGYYIIKLMQNGETLFNEKLLKN